MQEITITTRDEAATEGLGRRLAGCLRPGTVLALHGELGAGKTVLARGLARGLGILEPVTSPTFTIVQEYRRPDGSWFYHLDMYRINGVPEALAFGIEEFLFGPNGVTVVEWPERIAPLLAAAGPAPTGPVASATGSGPDTAGADVPLTVHVHLAHAGGDTRTIRLPAGLGFDP